MNNFFEGQTVVYEVDRGYMGKLIRIPANEFAIVMCELMGISTLTDNAVSRIKAQGIPMISLQELGREQLANNR